MSLFDRFRRPLFCEECGSPVERRSMPVGYDRETGEPRIRHFYICSSAKGLAAAWPHYDSRDRGREF